MGRQVLTADAFARLAKRHEVPSDAIVRGQFAPKIKTIDEIGRSIDFVISTSFLDRDNDTIDPKGWTLDAYLQNPVVLWAHDQSTPPVARAQNTAIADGALISTAIFTPPDLNPFGDMIFRMYVQQFLNAVSVGFKPSDYDMRSESDARGWGIDYTAQELLEYSCVAVPSNPQALARAKAAGIDTAPMIDWCAHQIEAETGQKLPKELLQKLWRAAKGESPTIHHMAPATKAELAMFNLVRGELDRLHPGAKSGFITSFDLMPGLIWHKGANGSWAHTKKDDADWKCGTAEDLPTTDKGDWDGPAAATRMLDDAGFGGDAPDTDKAKRGFLAYDASNQKLRGSYKLPIADLVDGKLTVLAAGVRAAASRLPDTDIPDGTKKSAQAVLDHYKSALDIGDDDKAAKWAAGTKQLYMSRPVTNGADIHKWMQSQGFKSAIKPQDMHVTLAFSKNPVDWSKITPDPNPVSVKGTSFTTKSLGDEGAVVMGFDHKGLQDRHQEIGDAGASWDYDSYQPHVTLSYNAGDVDPTSIEPYSGDLELGPEKMEPLDTSAEDKIEETPLDPDDDEDTQGDPDGDDAPGDELLLGDGQDDNADTSQQQFQTTGGPGDHQHDYDLGETMTKEAGDPPHTHGVTWGQEGSVTIGEADGHTHEPDPISLDQIQGDGQPNGTNTPPASDESVPMRAIEDMLRKLIREEMGALENKDANVDSIVFDLDLRPAADEIVLLDDEPAATKGDGGILDGYSLDDLAKMIDTSSAAAMDKAIRRAQGKID